MIPVPSHENICGVSGVIISTQTRGFIDTGFWFRIHFDMCGLIMSAGGGGGGVSEASGFKPMNSPHLCAFKRFWRRRSAEKLRFLPPKVSWIGQSDVWQQRVASE